MTLQAPVVITGLFADRPIHRVTTLERCREMLGEWPLEIQSDYLLDLLKRLDGAEGSAGFYKKRGTTRRERLPPRLSLSEFLDAVSEKPVLDQMSQSAAIPDKLRLLLSPRGPDRERSALEAPSKFIPFIASRGVTSPLHYDWDYRHALLYQVFGRKRAVLAPPRAYAALRPIGDISLLLLGNVPRQKRSLVLARLAAFETLLEPGEALYIPPGWWHELEYVDTAMSISVRFEHSAAASHLRELWSKVHHQGPLACLAQKFIETVKTDAALLPKLKGLLSLAAQSTCDPLLSLKRVQDAVESTHAALCKEDHIPAGALDDLPPGCWARDSFVPTAKWLRFTAQRYYGSSRRP